MKFITSNRTLILISNSIIIKETIFYFIFHNNSGGAIHLDNTNLNNQIFSCSFDHCISSLNGGGIIILKSNKSLMKNICFSFCKAKYCPGILIYGNIYISIYSEMNFTNDFNPDLTGQCSAIVSNSIKTFNNNISTSYTNYESSGFYYGSILSENLGSYSQISNSNGPSFFGICMLNTNLNPFFNYLNFLNNSCELYWIKFHTNNNNPNFYNCQFKDLTIKPLISSIGLIQFFNCEFNFLYNNNYHLSISTNNNYFNLTIKINIFEFQIPFYCWNDFQSKKLKILFKNYILLINLLIN